MTKHQAADALPNLPTNGLERIIFEDGIQVMELSWSNRQILIPHELIKETPLTSKYTQTSEIACKHYSNSSMDHD